MVSTELPPLARAESVLELADFDEVVRLYRPRIFRFLMGSLGDRDLAESLTQDCFLKAYTARHQFRGDSSLATWLTRIALNLVRDHLRNRRMRFWQKTRDTALDIVDVGEWIPDGARSPEEVCLQQERVREIWRSVEKLSRQQRTVFLLRFVEEMELSEIAETTGMNTSTVKSHLYRALRIVRERALGKSEGEL
ncbi:MAG: RNA polymerase sigma factor [Silvibacterium sp.]|nr:RNA polymerase sigma factor [Silvibacterium sp.]MBV8437122.1 RNA polymerase sigma factor [Silvibacterium sp.]